MSSICLNMIVKNEGKIITRLFDTVLPLIDTYRICDTGSTDDTVNIIKNYFSSKGIPGKVIVDPFKDFAYSRNKALSMCKGDSTIDYILLVDADMKLVLNIDNVEEWKNSLDKDAYKVFQGNSGFQYANVRLVKNSDDVSYWGVTHEYVSLPEKAKVDTLSKDVFYIDDIGDGGSKANKFERDVQLLTRGLEDNPNNPRYTFYLANSYKSLNQHEKAIPYYEKRIALGGWIEEVTCSYEYLGGCYNAIGSKQKAFSTWMEGYHFNPNRAECLYEAIRHLRSEKKYNLALSLAKLAKKIPYPSKDILFVRKSVYDHLIDTELTLIAYYSDENEDITKNFRSLLNNPNAPFLNTLSNYKFYCPSINDMGTDLVSIDDIVAKKENYNSSTPCIIPFDNDYLINVRQVSYELDRRGYGVRTKGSKGINTVNTIVRMDKELKEVKQSTLSIAGKLDIDNINGLEDQKLVQVGNKLFSSGNMFSEGNGRKMVLGEVDTESLKVSNYKDLESPLGLFVEKNWSFFDYKGKLACLYNWNPISFFIVEDNKLVEHKKLNTSLQHFRGSSNGFLYDGKLYFLAHLTLKGEPSTYYHSIVVFNAETLEYIEHSVPFVFERPQIEFSLGLVIRDEDVILGYSTWDRTCKIKSYNKKDLFNTIHLKDEPANINKNLLYMVAIGINIPPSAKEAWSRYCKKIGCDFKIITELSEKFKGRKPHWERYNIFETHPGYDNYIYVDVDSLPHWNCPDLFEELSDSNKFYAVKELGNLEWIYKGLEGYKDLFEKVDTSWDNYVASGFLKFSKNHKNLFEKFVDFEIKNRYLLIEKEDKTVVRGVDQNVLNLFLRDQKVDLEILPESYSLGHLYLKCIDKGHYFLNIPCKLWQFNGMSAEGCGAGGTQNFIEQTWNKIKHKY